MSSPLGKKIIKKYFPWLLNNYSLAENNTHSWSSDTDVQYVNVTSVESPFVFNFEFLIQNLEVTLLTSGLA